MFVDQILQTAITLGMLLIYGFCFLNAAQRVFAINYTIRVFAVLCLLCLLFPILMIPLMGLFGDRFHVSLIFSDLFRVLQAFIAFLIYTSSWGIAKRGSENLSRLQAALGTGFLVTALSGVLILLWNGIIGLSHGELVSWDSLKNSSVNDLMFYATTLWRCLSYSFWTAAFFALFLSLYELAEQKKANGEQWKLGRTLQVAFIVLVGLMFVLRSANFYVLETYLIEVDPAVTTLSYWELRGFLVARDFVVPLLVLPFACNLRGSKSSIRTQANVVETNQIAI